MTPARDPKQSILLQIQRVFMHLSSANAGKRSRTLYTGVDIYIYISALLLYNPPEFTLKDGKC